MLVIYLKVIFMSLLSNAKWNAFSQLFKIVLQMINVIYLAKIIPPQEYGIMGMAMVIINLGILLRDLGTSAALIQRKILTEELKNTVFWLNLIMGLGIGCLVLISSGFVADVYEQPKLVVVLSILSIIFPLSSCAAAHLALMERESKFKKISFIEITSSVTAVICAIVSAKMGLGVFSLAIQAIVLNLISTLLFWKASSWRPSVKIFIRAEDVRSIFGFSSNLALFNFINYFSRNADNFIIGKFMSAAILGSYNLAYRIMLFPLQSLTFVASRSLYPVLSTYQDDNYKIKNTYYKCIFFILMITAPLMTGIAIYSESFILLVFGPQWHLTSDILKWLAPTAIIQSVLSTTGAVFSAKGRTDILMRLGVLGSILQVGAFLIGAKMGIVFFSMCYLIANVLNFFPVMYFLLKIINGNFLSFFRINFSVFLATMIMMFFAYSVNRWIYPHTSINNLISLFFISLLCVIVYSLSLFLLSSQFRGFFKRK